MTRWLAMLLALGACEVAYQPEVGPLARAEEEQVDAGGGVGIPGDCGDSDPEVDVSLENDVRPLMYRSPGGCSCHASGSTSGFNLGTYATLRRGGFDSGERIIVPGAPCDSVLVQKLGPAPPFGSRMPFNGPPYLEPGELALIMDWIAEGALDN
jgi:hypothetical protein